MQIDSRGKELPSHLSTGRLLSPNDEHACQWTRAVSATFETALAFWKSEITLTKVRSVAQSGFLDVHLYASGPTRLASSTPSHMSGSDHVVLTVRFDFKTLGLASGLQLGELPVTGELGNCRTWPVTKSSNLDTSVAPSYRYQYLR